MVEGPSPVAVGLDELDDGMLGGGPGSEACPAAHFVLHRGEERLGHGVVVQSPVRLHDRRTSLVRAPTRERPVVYWELLSLQNMAFPATYLRDFADSSAATAMSSVMRSESNRQPPCACTGRPRRLGRASPPQYEGMLSRRPACRWKRGS